MKVLVHIATLSSLLIISGSAWAQDANDGVPFGKGIIAPTARGETDQSLKDAIHEQGPGNVDDKIQSNLGDEEDGDVRGHGRDAAPGQQ
jgi:hypothetical protein